MPNRMIHLVFPQKLIKEPVVYTAAKKFDIIPNIRRANVTATVGEMTLELSGAKVNLEKAVKYLEKAGIKVEPIVGDIVE